MPDKQIGVKLDVKSTGMVQVEKGIENLRRNLSRTSEQISTNQHKGWGSKTQTSELKEQVRYMRQLYQETERMARNMNLPAHKYNEFFGRTLSEAQQQMSRDERDINTMPAYSRTGGAIRERFGPRFANAYESASGWAGRGAAGVGAYAAYRMLGNIHQGMSNGQELSFGLGNFFKRMAPGVYNSNALGMNYLNNLQGFGYSDQSLMQNSTAYGAATGKMMVPRFKGQMRAIENVGRRYGLDLSQVTGYFSGAWQSGVTGGTTAQLNPQEYANLVANAVNRGNMQGKESQVMGQLQSFMSMNAGTFGGVGNISQIAGLISAVNRSGNQGLINNQQSLYSSINAGIQNPGGGVAGQSLEIKALQKAYPTESFYQIEDRISQGFTPSNYKAFMNYFQSSLPGWSNKNKQSYMLSHKGLNWGNQDLLKQFMNSTENPDGSLKDLQTKGWTNLATDIKMNKTDQFQVDMQKYLHPANSSGMGSQGIMGWLHRTGGGLLGGANHILGTPAAGFVEQGLLVGGGIGLGGKVLSGTGRGISKVGRSLFSKGASNAAKIGSREIGTTVAEGATGTAADLGAAGGLEMAGAGFDASGIGLPIGLALGAAGLAVGGYGLWRSHHQAGAKNSLSGVTGADLAPIVASTIMAMGPYMNQIRAVMGVSSTGLRSSGTPTGKVSVASSSIFTPSSGTQVVPGSIQHSLNQAKDSNPSFTGTNKPASDLQKQFFLSRMRPFAKQESARTGLPEDLILSQWGVESNWGTSKAAIQNNNDAGIKPWGSRAAGPDSKYAGYSSKGDFATGYGNFYLQNPRYKSLLQAAKNGASSSDLIQMLAKTGYATDPNYAKSLTNGLGYVDKQLNIKGSVTLNIQGLPGGDKKVKVPVTAKYTGQTPPKN